MADNPTTYRGESAHTGSIDWDDRADLHRVGDGDGVFDKAKGLRSGTFAELIEYIALLPESERADYEINKAGDRTYSAAEAMALHERADFPRAAAR